MSIYSFESLDTKQKNKTPGNLIQDLQIKQPRNILRLHTTNHILRQFSSLALFSAPDVLDASNQQQKAGPDLKLSFARVVAAASHRPVADSSHSGAWSLHPRHSVQQRIGLECTHWSRPDVHFYVAPAPSETFCTLDTEPCPAFRPRSAEP